MRRADSIFVAGFLRTSQLACAAAIGRGSLID